MNEKTKARRAGRRFSRESQQEQRSLGQVREWLAGWNTSRVENDLGEDLLVQVFDDGVASGVHFYLQVKSTTDLQKFRARNRSCVSWRVRVKDLTHWEISTTPVVLLVWDVDECRGYWLDVVSAIQRLELTKPAWRTRASTTVEIPRSNPTTEEGKARMRQAVAIALLPIISHGRAVNINAEISFPDTQEGRSEREKLRKTVEEGGALTVEGDAISQFCASDWLERALGGLKPLALEFVSAPGDSRFRVQVVVTTAERMEVVDVELRLVAAGTKATTLTNDHEDSPFRVVLRIEEEASDRTKASMTLSFRAWGVSITSALLSTRFLVAAAEGGVIGARIPPSGIVHSSGLRLAVTTPVDELRQWQQALERLHYVQSRVSRFGQFDLRRGLTEDDFGTIDHLHAVVSTGYCTTEVALSFEPVTPLVPTTGGLIVDSFGEVPLLGLTVPLGAAKVAWEETAVLQAAAAQAGPAGAVQVPSSTVHVTFFDWVPPAAGPPNGGHWPA